VIAAHHADADHADAQAAAAKTLSLAHNAKSPPPARPYPRFPVTMSDPTARPSNVAIRTQIASQAYGRFCGQMHIVEFNILKLQRKF
jgi:hypothetical protein